MTPLGSEFDKFVTKVTKFMENAEQHIAFLRQQLIHTQIELYALKNELENKNDTTKN